MQQSKRLHQAKSFFLFCFLHNVRAKEANFGVPANFGVTGFLGLFRNLSSVLRSNLVFIVRILFYIGLAKANSIARRWKCVPEFGWSSRNWKRLCVPYEAASKSVKSSRIVNKNAYIMSGNQLEPNNHDQERTRGTRSATTNENLQTDRQRQHFTYARTRVRSNLTAMHINTSHSRLGINSETARHTAVHANYRFGTFFTQPYVRKPSTQKRLLLFGPVYSHRHNKPVTIIDRENFNEPIDERFWSFFTCERCRFQYLAKSWRFWFAQLERSIDVATKKTDNKLIKRHTGTYGALRHHCKLKKTQKSTLRN